MTNSEHIFLIFEPIFGTVTLLNPVMMTRDRLLGLCLPLPAVLLLLLLQRHRVSCASLCRLGCRRDADSGTCTVRCARVQTVVQCESPLAHALTVVTCSLASSKESADFGSGCIPCKCFVISIHTPFVATRKMFVARPTPSLFLSPLYLTFSFPGSLCGVHPLRQPRKRVT